MSGVLAKYNKKTVTVITDNGEHWNVALGLLAISKGSKVSEDKRSNANSNAQTVKFATKVCNGRLH